MGHAGRGCPNSWQARRTTKNSKNTNNNNNTTRDDSNNITSQPSTQANLTVKSDGQKRVVMTTQPSSKSEEDLRTKLDAKRAAKPAPRDQVETTAQIYLPPQKEIEADELQGQQIDREGGVTM